jgi:hypothetical protein
MCVLVDVCMYEYLQIKCECKYSFPSVNPIPYLEEQLLPSSWISMNKVLLFHSRLLLGFRIPMSNFTWASEVLYA